MFGYARYYIQRTTGTAPSCDPIPPGTRESFPQELRTDFYDTPSIESVSNMVVDQYGAAYVVGSFSKDYEDPTYNDTLREAVLWKINSNGDLLWQRGLTTDFPDGYKDESFTGVAVDSQSNVYVTGHSNEQTWPAKLIVGKCDACGTFKWKKILKQTANTETLSGVRCAVNGAGTKLFVVGGITRFDTYQYSNLLLICFDAGTGDVIWNREVRYPVTENYYGLDIGVDSSDNVIVVSEPNGTNYVVAKFSENGDSIWTKEILNETPQDGGPYSAIAGAESTSHLHHAYLLGGLAAFGPNDSIYVSYNMSNTGYTRLMKIDPSTGDDVWEVELHDEDLAYTPSNARIFVGSNNQLYIAYEKNAESFSTDYTVENAYAYIRTVCLSTTDGSLIFDRQLTFPTEEVCQFVSVNVVYADENNYYVGGELVETNPESNDYYPRGFIFRFPLNGSQTDFYHYIRYTDDSTMNVDTTFTNLTHTIDSTATILATGPGSGVTTPGRQDIVFEPLASGTIVGQSTGIANDSTEYRMLVTVDSGAPVEVPFVGSEIQTFDELVAKLQAALPSCTVAYEGTNAIRVTTLSAGETSLIYMEDLPLVGGDGYDLVSTNHVDSSSSIAEFTFTGPAVLNFDWVVDSETGYDGLYVEVDTIMELDQSGRNLSGTFSKAYGPGLHNLYIEYYKDSSVSEGLDIGRILTMYVTDPGGITQVSNTGFAISGGPGTSGGVATYPGLINVGFNGGTSPWNTSYYYISYLGSSGDFRNISEYTGFKESTFTHPHVLKSTQPIGMKSLDEAWILQTNGNFSWEDAFTVDSENNLIIVEDLRVIKLSPQGNIIWIKQFPTTPQVDFVYADGTDIVIITRYATGGGSSIERFDKDFNRLWRYRFSSGDVLFGYIDGAGGISASTRTSGIVRFDVNTGNVLWTKDYTMSLNTTWRTAGDASGNTYFVAGGYDAGANRNSVTKVDINGNLVWHKNITHNPAYYDDLQYGFDMEWDSVIRFDDVSQTLVGIFTIWSHMILIGFDAVTGEEKWQLCLAQLYDNFPRPLGSTINSDGHLMVCVDTFRTTIFVVDPGTGALIRKFFLAPEDRGGNYPLGARIGLSYNEAWGIAADSAGYFYAAIGDEFLLKLPNEPDYGFFQNVFIDNEFMYTVDDRQLALVVDGTFTSATDVTYTHVADTGLTTTNGTSNFASLWRLANTDPVKEHYEQTGLQYEMVPMNGNKMFIYMGEPLAYQYGRQVSVDGDTLVVYGDPTMYIFNRHPNGYWDTSTSRAYNSPAYSGIDYITDGGVVGDYVLVGSKGAIYSQRPGFAHILKKQPDGTLRALQSFRSSTTTTDIDDGFGQRVALSTNSNMFVVSKHLHLVTPDIYGQIVTYEKTPNRLWTLTNTAQPPTTTNTNWGNKGTISRDGNIALIGGGSTTFVQSLEFVGGQWIHQAELSGLTGISYGQATSYGLSNDGTVAVIGAESLTSSKGGAYVFTRSGATWTLQTTLVASDGVASDYFGGSVGISGNGKTIVVGSRQSDVTGTSNSGAVYVFTENSGVWTQTAKLFASNKAINNYFGSSVAVSEDGLVIAIGATGRGGYLFRNVSGTWTEQQFISGTGLGTTCSTNSDGSVVAFTASTTATTVSVYRHNGTSWIGTNVGAPEYISSATFGWTTAISSDGNLLLISAPTLRPTYGKVFSYVWSGTSWTPYQPIHETREAMWESGSPGAFGRFVGLTSANNILIGVYGSAWQFDPGGYYYEKIADGWVEHDTFTSPTPNTGFGYDMELLPDNQTLFVISKRVASPSCEVMKLERVGGAWQQSETITIAGFSSINNVSCDSTGTRMAVGGEGTDAPYTRQHGKVVVLEKQGASWVEIFNQSGPHEGAWFGTWDFSVKLSSNGNSLIVGSPGFEDNKLIHDNHTGQMFIYWNVTDPSSAVKYLPHDSQFYYARFGRCVTFDTGRGAGCFLASNASHFSDLSSWSTDPINDIGGMVYAISSVGV